MTLKLHNEHGRRAELARFGYRSDEGEPERLWRTLRRDFPGRAAAAELADLPDIAQEKAREYCLHRATMDRLLDRCDAIHLSILRGGPDAAVVEDYAVARDAFEDSVERFGELRAEVQKRLVG